MIIKMPNTMEKPIKYLVVDTTAFIQNEPLLHLAENIVSVADVVSEIKNKRQLRRLCVLPYELVIKEVFPENVKIMAEFSKKTGDYPSLSATDIKVMALTYQLEKEFAGIKHLRSEPITSDTIIGSSINKEDLSNLQSDFAGFYNPNKERKEYKFDNTGDRLCVELDLDGNESECRELGDVEILKEKFASLEYVTADDDKVEQETVHDLVNIAEDDESEHEETDEEDDIGWITPFNIRAAKKQVNDTYTKDEIVQVACMTTDFAMQNVLKQMNLNVSALNGRIIKQLRTFILRCYTCFKTTSIMTSMFCPKCGNNTMKKVSVSVDTNGKQIIHINNRHPLTTRGKKFSLPTMKGGKHSRNPILVSDQPMPDQRPTRIARTKTSALDDNYIAGYSPFAVRDVNSKSALLKIRSIGAKEEIKHWMRRNPNEARPRRK